MIGCSARAPTFPIWYYRPRASWPGSGFSPVKPGPTGGLAQGFGLAWPGLSGLGLAWLRLLSQARHNTSHMRCTAAVGSYHFWSPPRGDLRQEFAAFGFPKTSPVLTRSQAREAASRSAAENLDSSSRTHSTPSPTIPGNFDRDEEDEIDQELQDDFDEEPIPSTAEERTLSPELLGLTTSDYATSTPDLFDQSGSSPEPEDPIPSTSNLVLPTPSSFRAHAQPPIASSSRLSVIPTSDLAPPPPLAPSNAASNSNPASPAPTNPSTTTASSSSPAPTNTTNMSQNTNTPLMPPCGHSTAPSFDPSEVRSLRRYFQDLEALFTQCQITDDTAKKQWAVRYPSIDVADLWETIESFIDVTKSYNDWKADVRALYPGADDTRKWSLADMDQLIGERARIGIHNAADLGCYYRDFMAITKHLIAQNRLSPIEQSRAFLRGFQPALLTWLETRLHLKHPDHYADDPSPWQKFMLRLRSFYTPTTHATHNHAPAPRQQAAVHVHENTGAEQTCHYCGNRGCRVGTCEFAEIDIRDGKCKRNTEGKIVLPNGSFCPRTIPGLTIRDRIYEWHRRNPAVPAAPTMLFEIDDRSTVQTFTLNTSGRIEALERELLQLRKRREVFDGVEILQRKKPTTTAIPRSAEASGSGTSKGVAAPPSTSTSTAPPPTIPAAAPASSSSPPTQSTSQPIATSAPPAPPVHPFANARDATYAPPNVRNFATPPKPSNDKGKEPAYKTIVPVIQPKLAEEIFQRSMKSQFVTLTPEELLSIAPDVRTKYRDAVTPKRVSTEPVASAHIVEIGADEVMTVNQLSCSGATLEPGATIVPDPYETYLKHIPHGEHPAEFTVARDSNAIRSIIALIDNKEQIECIVDPGSQIVAMSEEVCLGLNLLFDPTIQLNMQSANGEVDRSLGLIRNVPFRIGEIVLYLQAHVIRNAVYDILLGRPFDVLTQSVVKNFADENQTITILCPNTGETVTIPTTLSGVANRIF
ncbi:predicted protein [Postia placenta Mad-698-R]|uniref:Peptidase A2 domain-containing protein n=1 Tax=Postia placenta MAD-698-R-SB12 TaxID=670580 RepID=A0A1X6N272_9APHY|nr:hypothetical protein POSPLADRAFT_1140953 [Postia placenta MAD-698-R-SB12]EED82441.1 predicted protein [Postia placenta Mad-698-R]OSX62610.1 hypothetical protein POSPLADRAFT_1140953 [Postia placenta MAD-698-R-SB12]